MTMKLFPPTLSPATIALFGAFLIASPATARDTGEPPTASAVGAETYSWQVPQAALLPNGSIEWAPLPYEFVVGEEVRYIDYENGDDNADGRSKETAWKHHPWDREATANAAAASGPISYVFKGGVAYRGQLLADESGEPGNPIRLTRDPAWGEGKPWFLGSEKLPSNWVPATDVEAPARLPEPEKVWAHDLKPTGLLEKNKQDRYRVAYFQPDGRSHWSPPGPSFTGLFAVSEGGETRTFHLASDPDWQSGDLGFAMSHWHSWQGPGKTTHEGIEVTGPQDERLKGKPSDYFEGGRLWSQYPLFMGTPISYEIPATTKDKKTKKEIPFYHPDEGIFVRGMPGGVKKDVRYMIENLPQYLDNEGEFYLDADTGFLYLRLAQDPNQLRLELTNDLGQIQIDGQNHIEIAGIQFGLASGDTVSVSGNASDITVRHCLFENVIRNAFKATLKMSRQEPSTEELTNIVVRDNDLRNIWESGISISDGGSGSLHHPYGRLRHAEILRNRLANLGFRHQGNVQSNIAALELLYPETGIVAGNLVNNTWGSGIVVFGGKEGNLGDYSIRRTEIPLIRVHVFHNLTQHCARAVNDYGGLALWQGGPLNAWSNNVGSSVGHMPGGFWGVPMTNLSYPLYLDGAYKVYSFNNLVWGASIQPDDPYRSRNSAYFMVFGFLNQFANNSVYRHAKGVGGSSGNRCDIVGNLFSEISEAFLANNRMGDPSLVGGGDDNAVSGVRGVPSLAFADNIFQGSAEAGTLLKQRYDRETNEPQLDIPNEIMAKEITKMREQMKTFPVRFAGLGEFVAEPPIVGSERLFIEDHSQVDFRPVEDSPAIDAGAIYFVPFSLYGTVGEWHFTENQADPANVVDYSFYFSEAHIHRMMYEQVPAFDLKVSDAGLGDYVEAPSETWALGALRFDGNRTATYPDSLMREDFVIPQKRIQKRWFNQMTDQKDPEEGHWRLIEQDGEKVYHFPAEKRHTPAIDTENLLIEAIFRADTSGKSGILLAKSDGESGYRLEIDATGRAVFQVSSGGDSSRVMSNSSLAHGEWRHLVAEMDRATGRMSLYLDGTEIASSQSDLPPTASLDNPADLMVGEGFVGDIDFLRLCKGTLEDAQTTPGELYAWQTNGPWKKDFFGHEAVGQRDAGAIEHR